jgi:hypothetical protein
MRIKFVPLKFRWREIAAGFFFLESSMRPWRGGRRDAFHDDVLFPLAP